MLSLIIEFIIYTIFIKGANLDIFQLFILWMIQGCFIILEGIIYYNVYYNWKTIKTKFIKGDNNENNTRQI